MTAWRFRPHRGDEKIRNPIQGEFFSEEAVERPAQALVREVIQNSLDARAVEGPVEVRVAVSGPAALSEEGSRFWLGGAWPHLRAEGSGLREVPEAPVACRYLAIEDFGTTGLDGDPAELRPEGAPSRLFAFFRAEGMSQKGGKDGGRWGVGKTVFLRASEINTVFCLTVRRSDGRRLAFGQSVLRYHWLDGRYFTPDGSFGEEGVEAIVPSEDPDLAARLTSDFALARGEQPGLSVVVPFAAEDLRGDAILEAVIREYYFPILTGRLEVTVEDPSLGPPRTLTAESLLEHLVLTKDLESSIGPLAALTVWLQREGLGRAVSLAGPGGQAPEWSATMLTGDVREALAGPYRRGETVLVRVPLTVHPVGEEARSTFFHVVLKRDLEDRGAAPAFVRNGIQIPKALERRVRGQNLWALVVIEDGPIATLLGDAETPAHTHWSKDTQNFRKKYRYGAATLDFVRSAPRFLAETLTEAAREKDFLSLAEFFPAVAPVASRAAHAPRPRPDGDAVEGTEPDLLGGGGAYRIERLDGGFRISAGSKRRKAETPAPFVVAVAYDGARGDPLKRWDPRDFDLASLPRQVEGAVLRRCDGNTLHAEPEGAAFRLSVDGFDPNRDLLLRISPVEDDEEREP